MKVFWNPVQLQHEPRFFLQRGLVKQNFEVPDRARALLDGVRALGLGTSVPPPAARSVLEAVHTPDYLDFLRDGPGAWAALPDHGAEMVPNIHPSPEMMENGARPGTPVIGRLGWFTADTSCPVAPETWPAARAAADCAVAAADEALAGRSAYALCRPPGHHAYAARAGGHCYLNNAALAAQRMIDGGMTRIAILDIDSHHGNGTQGLFWHRSDVLFVSIHGDPDGYYPWYVGRANERGGAVSGLGFNLNIPLQQGTGDTGWLVALQTALEEVGKHGVDGLVVSLGFDASEHEPLGFLRVTEDGFARAGAALAGCGYPAVIVQEGGYNTDVIGRLLQRFLGPFNG